MQHYSAAAFNYTIHHASYLAAGLIECAVGGVANPAFSTPSCMLGVLTGMEKLHLGGCGHVAAGVYMECIGMYVCV